MILKRTAYTVSYNPDLKIPNWVAWHLTAEHADGEVKRFNGYLEDVDVPEPRATQEDYKGCGWSHGHLCPAGDNKWDELNTEITEMFDDFKKHAITCKYIYFVTESLFNK